ncbi:MAG TPA: hypothetical protein VGQ83_32290, partial [Polyangia bacterium]
ACNGAETCGTCPADCGVCPPVCGDGACNGAETCGTCPADCGVCPPACGDGLCNGAETCGTCPADCGVCPPACGDGLCNGAETCESCAADCGACPPPPHCGDGICQADEACGSCALDCGACPPADVCGDGSVSLGTVDMENDSRHPLYGYVYFDADPWRRHYLCIVNGDPDGRHRSSHVIAWVNGQNLLNPSDFMPQSNPPAVVTAPFAARFFNYAVVKLFGPRPPEHIRVDIREEW